MAIKFAVNQRCWYDNANWMDNIWQFSWAGWVRFDTIDTTQYQFVWAHPGATDRMEVYKRLTNPQYVRFQVYAGGVGMFVDDESGVPVAGTAYHFAVTWTPHTTGGMKIYRNGTLVGTANTTTQTANYNSGGSVDLFFAAKNAMSYGLCTLEGHSFWTDSILTANQIQALYWCGWPHLCAPKPAASYPFERPIVNRFRDASGNGRHILPAWIGATNPSSENPIGKWDDPHQDFGECHVPSAAGPADPNPWTYWATTTHPTVASTVTGLSNGTTYEFSTTAVDSSANESLHSAIYEAMPSAVAARHTPRRKFFGH